MKHFGGCGGIWGGRSLDEDDLFEMTVNRVLGDRIREKDETARAMWCALANVDWNHTNGDTAGYSFRAAGDLVAAIRGNGNYMDWYCCGNYETVRDDIEEALAREGWSFILDSDRDTTFPIDVMKSLEPD